MCTRLLRKLGRGTGATRPRGSPGACAAQSEGHQRKCPQHPVPAAAVQVESVTESPPEAEVVRAHLRQDGCTGSIVFVAYDTIKTALEAVTRLHTRPLHQPEQPKKKQKGQQKEKGSQPVTLPRLWARQVSGEGMHLKKWRLIIRNIPFTVSVLGHLAG